MISHACRFCHSPDLHSFVDLRVSPFSNSLVKAIHAQQPDIFYPLHAYVCGQCFLVQIAAFEQPNTIFNESYPYFSSASHTWLAHAKEFAQMTMSRFDLNKTSQVVEVASNDGYLLQYFSQMGIPALGIEPSASVARAAEKIGVRTLVEFLSQKTIANIQAQAKPADLVVANNVVAHVPDVIDFLSALRSLLKPSGVASLEFPHLLNLISQCQFDTIYHEHFSYFSLATLSRILHKVGLHVFSAQEINTHGGSLRIFASPVKDAFAVEPSVHQILKKEKDFHLDELAGYQSFSKNVAHLKRQALSFLIKAREENLRVCAYGAPAKGNTFLNYCGIGTDLIEFTVDAAPSKQNTLLPGSRIPVLHPDRLFAERPDFIVILPWNLRREIGNILAPLQKTGSQLVTFIPELQVL